MPRLNQLSVGSLFAGIGGIELGFKDAGFEIAWANEIDEKSCKTYTINHGNDIVICDDIRNIDHNKLTSVDILTAGFPCQAFSIAGYQNGFADERGAIFFDLMVLIKQIKPRILFLENVKNLKSHNKGNTLNCIIEELESCGYFIKYAILNTSDYSIIPQNRERIYIVGFRNKIEYENFEFPKKEPLKNRLLIADLLEKSVSEGFYYTSSKLYPELKLWMKNYNTCYQWRRRYVRENKNNLCPTLTANMGTGGHNVPLILDDKGIRKLTPRECARFQGFPDTFMFPSELPNSILYKQIGNSVSVPVINKIAKQIYQAIKKGGL